MPPARSASGFAMQRIGALLLLATILVR